jgi:hypothetical protein
MFDCLTFGEAIDSFVEIVFQPSNGETRSSLIRKG